jgi:hypothetical protein
MTKGVKHPSPFKINMDPDEALERFIGTKPKEVDELIRRGKQKKPPGAKGKASGGRTQTESANVVSLRRRRMRKRNEGR